MTPPAAPVRLALLASGRGSNLRAIVAACHDGSLAATPVVAISNNAGAGALEHARRMGVPTLHLNTDTGPAGCEAADQALLEMLAACRADLVLLAGYLRPIGRRVLAHYQGRILNIHPGPLPEFGGQGMYGMRVHRAVLAAGCPATAAVVHLVDEGYDTGPVLAERRVPVQPGDTPETLAARVLQVEHDLYVQTLRRILAKELPLPGIDGRIRR